MQPDDAKDVPMIAIAFIHRAFVGHDFSNTGAILFERRSLYLAYYQHLVLPPNMIRHAFTLY